MPLYTQKPHTVEAVQFVSMKESLDDITEFIGGNVDVYCLADKITIVSTKSKITVSPGDYVIRNPSGNFISMAWNVFEKLYDPVVC